MANMSEEWGAALSGQDDMAAQAAFAENQKVYDGYHSLIERGRMEQQQRRRAADNALASMLIEARRSGNGMVPAEMCTAVSQDCGMDIAGGVLLKDGNLQLLTHAKDGSVVPFPNGSGLITPSNQFGVLHRTGLGKDLQKEIYDGFRKKYTEAQLQKVGIRRPIVDPDHIANRMGGGAGGRQVGEGATFKGRDTRPHGIHAFSSDGKGGFSSMDWTPEEGETRRDWGTRDPNYQGKWKWISSGPDGKVWVNDKTGEEVRTKPDENLRDVLMRGQQTAKPGQTGSGVEIAKINAASREKVAGLNTGSRERIAEGNNQTKRDIAGAQIASREKIADAANVLKQYGIDVSAALKERGYDLQEGRDEETERHNKAGEELAGRKADETERHNRSGEGIAGSRQREQERHNKEQERLRGASVTERERHNRAAEGTAERRADTQQQRADDQYELGDRKQTHNENRLANDQKKSERAADQRDAELAEKKREFDEREKRLSKPKEVGGGGEDARKTVAAMKGMLELARTSGMKDEDLADLETWTNEKIKGMTGGGTSDDGGTKGKVKYTDLKPGQKFTIKGKDGKKHRCVKTEKGYKQLD